MIVRHGDLVFTPLKEIPQTLKDVLHKNNFLLAEGEYTGHKHVITVENPDNMKIYTDTSDPERHFILQLKSVATVTHKEHKPIEIPMGIYKMKFEREYDYFLQNVKTVQD